MQNTKISVLSQIYKNFSEKKYEAAFHLCSDQMTFQLAGKSKLAGKFSKADMAQKYFQVQDTLSQGSYEFEVHDILASDLHATVLGTARVTLNGKKTEMRMVHVWRFEGETPLAGYEYPRDLYQFDGLFSST